MIQTAESGGGEIYFDDERVRRDGRFVTAEFEALNPELLRSRTAQPSRRSTP